MIGCITHTGCQFLAVPPGHHRRHLGQMQASPGAGLPIHSLLYWQPQLESLPHYHRHLQEQGCASLSIFYDSGQCLRRNCSRRPGQILKKKLICVRQNLPPSPTSS